MLFAYTLTNIHLQKISGSEYLLKCICGISQLVHFNLSSVLIRNII